MWRWLPPLQCINIHMEETLSPSESTLLVTIISSNRASQTPEVFFFYFLLCLGLSPTKLVHVFALLLKTLPHSVLANLQIFFIILKPYTLLNKKTFYELFAVRTFKLRHSKEVSLKNVLLSCRNYGIKYLLHNLALPINKVSSYASLT